jgi:hypothetical protein
VAIYPAGQLLVVIGDQEGIDLIEQTLQALKQKAEFEKSELANPLPVK